MFVLKLIGKVCVLPVIIVLAVLLGIVKVCVGIYSFARALFGLLVGALVILTVIFYQDWLQIRHRFVPKHIRKVKELAFLNGIFTAFSKVNRIELFNHKVPVTDHA